MQTSPRLLKTLGFARYYLLQDLHNNTYVAVGKHENILLKLLMNFAVRLFFWEVQALFFQMNHDRDLWCLFRSVRMPCDSDSVSTLRPVSNRLTRKANMLK